MDYQKDLVLILLYLLNSISVILIGAIYIYFAIILKLPSLSIALFWLGLLAFVFVNRYIIIEGYSKYLINKLIVQENDTQEISNQYRFLNNIDSEAATSGLSESEDSDNYIVITRNGQS